MNFVGKILFRVNFSPENPFSPEGSTKETWALIGPQDKEKNSWNLKSILSFDFMFILHVCVSVDYMYVNDSDLIEREKTLLVIDE